MVEDSTFFISKQRRIAAWLVHLFTASGAVLGVLSLWAIHEGRLIEAFWFMSGTLLIDSVDGVMARRAQTKVAAPKIDGALLDNMVDYFTYVVVPAFFLLAADLLPAQWGLIGVSIMVLASAYQFTQVEAKTDDHFFTGFPSYWNIVVFYFFMLQSSPQTNLFIILLLSLLIFIPMKYVYPSRLDYLTPHRWVRRFVFAATIVWGIGCAGMLITYPDINPIFIAASMSYVVLYAVISLYRSFVPVRASYPDQD